jgi:hypothetical protein
MSYLLQHTNKDRYISANHSWPHHPTEKELREVLGFWEEPTLSFMCAELAKNGKTKAHDEMENEYSIVQGVLPIKRMKGNV